MMINYLTIKSKLAVLVLPLVLFISVLLTHNMYNMWQKSTFANDSYLYQSLSSKMANLVYELQLERGSSIGYLSSKGKIFDRNLKSFRSGTNHAIQLLNHYLESTSLKSKLGEQQQHYANLLVSLQQLELVRAQVDTLNQTNKQVLKFYTNLINSLLYLIQNIGTRTSDVYIERYSGGFIALLRLQEHSGLERAALNAVFSSGNLDIRTAQMIQKHIVKQETTLKEFRLLTGMREYKMLLDQKLADPAIKKVNKMREMAIKKGEKSELLNSLLVLIGYGGLMHDFKNYVLRGNSAYRDHFIAKFEKTQSIIEKYRQLSTNSKGELKNLSTLESTLKKYNAFLPTIAQMKINHTSATKIDRVVKINDAPALQAINMLQKNLEEPNPREWFQFSTKRIALIKDVSDRIAKNIANYSIKTSNEARRHFIVVAMITVMVLLTILFVAFTISKQLIFGITRITQALSMMKETGEYNGHLDEQGSDEISFMAKSFNNLNIERKRIEMDLAFNHNNLIAAMQDADNANKAKSEFLANMSHELRTPLNCILGFAQILESEDNLCPETLQNVHYIHQAGQHLLELINDILNLAKIESGHIELTIEPVRLDTLIRETIDLIEPMAKKTDIKLLYDAKIQADVILEADAKRLKEVMLNLLSNAVKYNYTSGKITITSELLSTKHVRIKITDTGKGLSEEQISNLFKPFERLGVESTNIEGTGIGLVICKRIIEKMNGKIGVDSTPGEGSTFWFELDCLPQIDNNVAELTNSNIGKLNLTVKEGQSFNILYVEDNLANLHFIEKLLGKYPYIDLKCVLTPHEGLDLVRTENFDLILIDINLPGMNGIELLKCIRKLDQCKEIPIVALSASSMPMNIEQAMNAGFTDYVTKPIHIAHFFSLLRQLLSPAEDILANNTNGKQINEQTVQM